MNNNFALLSYFLTQSKKHFRNLNIQTKSEFFYLPLILQTCTHNNKYKRHMQKPNMTKLISEKERKKKQCFNIRNKSTLF